MFADAISREVFDKPGHLIRRLQQIAVAIFIDETAAYNLRPVQYATLLAVRLRPGMEHARLAESVALDRSTLVDVVRRLEARGLVRRETTEEDRRVKLVYLTDEGAAVLDAVEAAVDRAQERILAPLKPEDRAPFLAMLQKIVSGNNDLSRAPFRTTEG